MDTTLVKRPSKGSCGLGAMYSQGQRSDSYACILGGLGAACNVFCVFCLYIYTYIYIHVYRYIHTHIQFSVWDLGL